MRVLLLKEVEHLGTRGKLVNVKDGFARNYLFPRKLATAATTGAEAYAARLEAVELKHQAEENAKMKILADKLGGVSCSLPRKAGDDEKLFGSVSSSDIAAALAAQGFKIDRKKIVLPEPLKALGVYTIPVRLSADHQANVKVWIVREAGNN